MADRDFKSMASYDLLRAMEDSETLENTQDFWESRSELLRRLDYYDLFIKHFGEFWPAYHNKLMTEYEIERIRKEQNEYE